jgi:hypothetical protein
MEFEDPRGMSIYRFFDFDHAEDPVGVRRNLRESGVIPRSPPGRCFLLCSAECGGGASAVEHQVSLHTSQCIFARPFSVFKLT